MKKLTFGELAVGQEFVVRFRKRDERIGSGHNAIDANGEGWHMADRTCVEVADDAAPTLNHIRQTGISEGLRRAAEHIMQAARNSFDSFERFGTEERQTARLRELAYELHRQADAAHPGTPNLSNQGQQG